MATETSSKAPKSTESEKNDRILIRSSHHYKDEYDECTSLRGRFHQHYIFGEKLDCSKWKQDYLDSKLWEKEKNTDALARVVEHERERIRDRLNPHYNNPVWRPRKDIPHDWDAPLPEFLTKNHENSLLEQLSAEIKGERPPVSFVPPTSFCCIL